MEKSKKALILLFLSSIFIFTQNYDVAVKKLEQLLPPTPHIVLDWTPVEKIPIPYEGRIVPFVTFANDTLFFIYGKTKFENESSTGIILKLALVGPNYAKNLKIINISNHKIKKELELPLEKNYFSLDNLHNKLQTIINLGTNIEQKKQQKVELTSFENQIYIIYQKLIMLQKIIGGDFYFIYDKEKMIWHKMNELEELQKKNEYTNLYKG
ncbi:MAG: hypothetical protein ACK4NF_07300, partial [Planctomycetota bacterium]